MTGKAHPDDVLIVGQLIERREYRQFEERQIVTVPATHRLQGRRIRKVWVSPLAHQHRWWGQMTDILLMLQHRDGTTAHSVYHWQPEEPSVVELIAGLRPSPESSIPFGWGYARAVKDVLELLAEHANAG